MIYLDSSALLKLIHQEHESDALEQWLGQRPGIPWVSSQVATVEVIRATRRLNADAIPEAVALLDSLDLIPVSADIIDGASLIGEPALRSLDAIHLASAKAVQNELSSFVVYDARLAAAAIAAGLLAEQPGA